jgi:hypothetical protein
MKLSIKCDCTIVCIVGDINNVLVAVDLTDDRVSSVDIFCSLKERSWTLDDRFLGCIMLACRRQRE